MKPTEFTLTASDSYPIHCTVYAPEKANQKVVLLNPANAVKQNYYAAFATYLAAQGYWVYTYDYRGIGKSKPPKLKGFEGTMSDWILKDYATVFAHILKKHHNDKKIVIGHSFGGQVMALIPESQHIDLGVMVASQIGYWKTWQGKGRRMMWRLAHILLPITSKIWGYVPAKIGLGQDLPKGVVLEWAKWIKSPDYLFDFLPESKQRCQDFNSPLLVWSFEDDDYAPLVPVKGLLKYFPNTPTTHKHLKPAEINKKEIGHFGFYRKHFEDTLWANTLQYIEEKLQEHRDYQTL